MNNHKNNRTLTLAAALVFITASMACGINGKSLVTEIKTGPTRVVDIRVPMPDDASSVVDLNMEFMAGELKLTPGNGEDLVAGTATFNSDAFKPNSETAGTAYTLRTGTMKIEGLPNFKGDFKNEWDLQIANIPMNLNIQAGAYTGSFELGGLSLKNLVISEGGSDFNCTFSEPNPVEMSSLTFLSGGSQAEMKGLANANFEQMTFTSGAGDYTLSFDGKLQRDANVKIDAGFGTLNIIVPEGVNAQVTYDGGLSTVNALGGWEKNGDIYTLPGSKPSLTFIVKIGAGTLNLKTE